MMLSPNRMRSIGWFALLGLCAALVLVLAFRVNALRSQVRHAENTIVALRQQKTYLETEFETRANQQQLKAWNDVEFGYVAPTSGQYLENERQLAALGKPAGPDAPAPIRVASADDSVAAQAAFPAMVSPLTGKALNGMTAADEKPALSGDAQRTPLVDHAAAAAALGKRLSTVERSDGETASHNAAAHLGGVDRQNGEKSAATGKHKAAGAGKSDRSDASTHHAAAHDGKKLASARPATSHKESHE
ncbi:hypothetical protein [Novosphingobium lentum]|uniref:hypothetical protein n=1 Tax=Novosphingobium lentum TaxID=145287 RepID=UPI000B1A3C67|nr:hypothetical protein [Novosphingobium lentum]